MLRSKINLTTASQLQYTKIEDIAYIQVRDNLSIRIDDVYALYALDGLGFNENILAIPDNGLNYWFIAFDSEDEEPVVLIPHGGAAITVTCDCTMGTGTCDSPELKESCLVCPCTNSTCSGDCKLNKTSTGSRPGIIVQAVSVYYKGTHYQVQ